MGKPKVSIIIPCYNAEHTIKSTIDSIKAQTYKDFEVIFVNDGSTDNTLSVIENYMVGSAINHTIITHEDKGVSVARNTGIEASSADYLMFLDADDIYHPSMVMYLMELIENTKADTVFCSYTRNVEDLPNMKFDNIGKTTILDNYKLQENFLFKYIRCGMWTFVYRKQILDKFNIRFNPATKQGEDTEFICKYLCHCNSGVALDTELYGYYDNSKSVGNIISIDKIDLLTTIYNIGEYLKNNNSSFYYVFHKFGYSRALWSILKNFSKVNRKDLFNTCTSHKKAKIHMIRLLQYPNFGIKLTSLLYIISPSLFFKCIKKFYEMGESNNVYNL